MRRRAAPCGTMRYAETQFIEICDKLVEVLNVVGKPGKLVYRGPESLLFTFQLDHSRFASDKIRKYPPSICIR